MPFGHALELHTTFGQLVNNHTTYSKHENIQNLGHTPCICKSVALLKNLQI